MTDHQPYLASRFSEAFGYARELHSTDIRKGSETPYLAHLMSVSALVLEFGGSEDQAIAGLLHDAAEGSTPAGLLAAEVESNVTAIRDHAVALVHDIDSEMREGRLREDRTREQMAATKGEAGR